MTVSCWWTLSASTPHLPIYHGFISTHGFVVSEEIGKDNRLLFPESLMADSSSLLCPHVLHFRWKGSVFLSGLNLSWPYDSLWPIGHDWTDFAWLLGLDWRGLAVFAFTFLDSIHYIMRLTLCCFLSDVEHLETEAQWAGTPAPPEAAAGSLQAPWAPVPGWAQLSPRDLEPSRW